MKTIEDLRQDVIDAAMVIHRIAEESISASAAKYPNENVFNDAIQGLYAATTALNDCRIDKAIGAAILESAKGIDSYGNPVVVHGDHK